MHPGRRFPLDGHLVGSIGEAAAEAMFALELQPASTAGHDAIACDAVRSRSRQRTGRAVLACVQRLTVLPRHSSFSVCPVSRTCRMKLCITVRLLA